jgi:hypothetical protein
VKILLVLAHRIVGKALNWVMVIIALTESIPDKSVSIKMDFGGNPASAVYSLEPDGDNTLLSLSTFANDAGHKPDWPMD